MRKTIYLHIGANKTGSTAIQAFLAANHLVLRKHGLVLPDTRLGLAGPPSGTHVRPFWDARQAGDTEKRLKAIFDATMAKLPAGQSLLVSAENLSQAGRAAYLAEVCKDHDVRVILYIRRQDDLIASSWQQFGARGTSDFDEWLSGAINYMGDWERVIDSWSAVGATKVDAAIYDRSLFTNGDVRVDFLERIGLKGDSDAFRFDASDVNPSYSDVVTDLVAGNRRLFPSKHDLEFQTILEDLGVGGETGPRKVSLMSREQRNFVVAHFEEKNRRTCARFFPGRDRLFAPVDHDRYAYLTREEMTRRQMNFVLETVVALYRKTQPRRPSRWRRLFRRPTRSR